MKNLAKRTLSLLLAALMVLALIPAHTPHAHAAATEVAKYGVNNSGSPYNTNVTLPGSAGVSAGWLTSYYAYAVRNGYVAIGLADGTLGADFDGKATVEIEYLDAFGPAYVFTYIDKDGDSKVVTPATTKPGTSYGGKTATIAVYELTDAGFNGTLVCQTGNFDFKGVTGAFVLECSKANTYFGIRSIVVKKGIEEPAPEDTVPPTFTPENWESCGLPEALVVHNDGTAAKTVAVTVSCGISINKNVTVPAGGEVTLLDSNALRTVIKEPGTYTVTITGYWNTNDAEHQINETITYIYKEHTAATPVIENERDATCDAPASHDEVIYCVDCENYVISRETITIGEALDHDMQLTAAEVPAECGKAGTTAVYTCANGCGKTEGGEEIPAKAHRYGNLVVNTFCEEDGYITITCGECGVTFDSREDQEAKDYLIKNPFFNLAPQGHRYDNDKDTTCNFCDYTRFAHYGSNVDLNGALDYNFYFTPSAGEIEGYYAVIEKNGVETTIELKDDMLNGSTYQITLPGVPAKEMVEEMTITIYDAEGNPISEPVTDSALLYAKRVLASDAFSTEAKTMVVDMLNYIAAAQEYFGYKADQLVTAGLTPEEKALGTQENPVCENNYTRSNEYYYGTNFDLENNISMNMYVTGIGEDGYGVIKYTNHLGEDIELTIQAADCQLSGSYYVFVVEGFVTADGACSEVEAKFYDGNDQLVVEVVDSLESYVARGAATYPWLYEVMKFANSTYEYLH